MAMLERRWRCLVAMPSRLAPRVDEFQATFDPVEPVSLIVQALMHVRDIGLQIRQMSLYRTYPMPHVRKLALHAFQRGADSAQVLQDQVIRHGLVSTPRTGR